MYKIILRRSLCWSVKSDCKTQRGEKGIISVFHCLSGKSDASVKCGTGICEKYKGKRPRRKARGLSGRIDLRSVFFSSGEGWDKTNLKKEKGRKIKKKGGRDRIGREESGVKCNRLAQHVLATEGRLVPSAAMVDFLSLLLPFLPAPGPPVNPASFVIAARRPFSRNRVTVRLLVLRFDSFGLAWLGSSDSCLASPYLALPCLPLPRSPTYLPRDRIIAQKIDEGIARPSPSVTVVERIPIV